MPGRTRGGSRGPHRGARGYEHAMMQPARRTTVLGLTRAHASRERPNEAGGVHGPQYGCGDCSHGGLPGGGALPGLPYAPLPGTSGLSALRPPHLHRLAQLRTALPHPTVRPLPPPPLPTIIATTSPFSRGPLTSLSLPSSITLAGDQVPKSPPVPPFVRLLTPARTRVELLN
jgi:hypothetical protein